MIRSVRCQYSPLFLIFLFFDASDNQLLQRFNTWPLTASSDLHNCLVDERAGD
jgi:RNase adaptor protein for sRNA GlmZ degradation